MDTTTLIGAATSWDQTTLGKYVVAGMAIIGGFIVVFAIFKAIKDFLSGKPGPGIKVLLGGAVIAAFMFKPSLITSLINLVSGVIEKVLQSGGEIQQ